MDYAAKGADWAAKADKRLKSFTLFGGNKYEEAAEMYEKAANQFKLAKAFKEAGETFMKLADVHTKLESRHDAASAWVEAAKAFLKVDQRRAVACLQQAVSLYTDMGRLGMAARQLREIAEVLEKEGDKEESIMFYEQAADLFATENSQSEANKCNLKIAQFAAELERYPQAIGIYESVARGCVDNNLLKYSAKGHLLNAGICQLCSADVATIRAALDRYRDIDLNFDNSREANFLAALADALDEGDIEAFTNAVAEFDSLTRLDAWKTALLVRVKRKLTSRQEDVEEEDLT
ncbi:Alpha-soluble NSF attachment 2 [Micractinium conductrix]|uniref:Alpha-soluble NSF attachment 2 n=1 Tax=Micractinium conductrix TaxID=554055 RepID=A0A2P6VJB4_9CHLO|nr:Alpha-soluble NSF attachment 2 [Micractinium conductrix]|eukprot:PSC74185.1 Alpha-soluble NSF attachment 2 [Micractinium conductrix]